MKITKSSIKHVKWTWTWYMESSHPTEAPSLPWLPSWFVLPSLSLSVLGLLRVNQQKRKSLSPDSAQACQSSGCSDLTLFHITVSWPPLPHFWPPNKTHHAFSVPIFNPLAYVLLSVCFYSFLWPQIPYFPSHLPSNSNWKVSKPSVLSRSPALILRLSYKWVLLIGDCFLI